VVEYPIVRVNDQIIDRGDYERAEQQLIEEAQHDNATPAELEQRKKDLLRDLIDKQLLLSRGKELDINVDSELIRLLDDTRKQYHFDSMEALEKAVRESGISYEDFKAAKRNDIIINEVERDEVGRNLHLTPRRSRPTTTRTSRNSRSQSPNGSARYLSPRPTALPTSSSRRRRPRPTMPLPS